MPKRGRRRGKLGGEGAGKRRARRRAGERLDPDALLTPADVAKLAGVSEAAVRSWRLYGGLPALTLGAGASTRHLYRRADVMRWLEAREHRLSALEATGRRLPPSVRRPGRPKP